MTVIVIGAGASGLLCSGILAQRYSCRVILLEKMEKCGRKIRISGKGRCNITNLCSLDDFITHIHGGQQFIIPVLHQFFNNDLCHFLQTIGIETVVERGNRVFPKSNNAWEIADKLEQWVKKMGVKILYQHQVTELVTIHSQQIKSVKVKTPKGNTEIFGDKFVVATGGKSYPATGSTGDGYKWLKNVGHNIIPLRPSLVGLIVPTLSKYKFRQLTLKNIEVTFCINKVEETLRGDIFFDANVMGGPIILKYSRKIVDALREKLPVCIDIDLKPALSVEKLTNRILREIENYNITNFSELLRKLLPSPLIDLYCDYVQRSKYLKLSTLNSQEWIKTAQALKKISFEINQTEGFERAVVTAGGIDTTEVDSSTMQSKLIDNLYIVGEILDIDGDTGGYNLQMAFSTAHSVILKPNNTNKY